ncbi:MAG: hypothetical protein IT562_10765 [Alphaproteobacteria bacterium]|nr:hypothetical protein [Alphaproteobacteria bacterium]
MAAVSSAAIPEARLARLALITKLLMGYPSGQSSAEAGKARGEVYEAALDDVPPWALAAAARKWHRGECEGNHDFAPAPARLRALCLGIIQPHQDAIAHLDDLLAASGTIEKALDPAEEPKGSVTSVVARAARRA